MIFQDAYRHNPKHTKTATDVARSNLNVTWNKVSSDIAYSNRLEHIP
jgi:hypothetical protein